MCLVVDLLISGAVLRKVPRVEAACRVSSAQADVMAADIIGTNIIVENAGGLRPGRALAHPIVRR
jgi:hypothetical protein